MITMVEMTVINKKMNMLIGPPIHRYYTATTVKIFMMKSVALTALSVSGRGLSETPKNGCQRMQLVAARPRRPSFGAQVVQISQMDYAGPTAQSVAWLASLTILTQQRHAVARPGKLSDL
jgi:hypothetical protein